MSGEPDAALPAPLVAIVDDDPDLLAALRFSLSADGYAVRAFRSGEALLANRDGCAGVACLILDQLLPGISGIDLLLALRREGIVCPAVMITTHPGPALRAAAARLGAAIVEKPLIGEELADAVRSRLAAAR